MNQVPQPLRGHRFGVFEVDVSAGDLRKQGLKVKLQEQPFQVLLILLERAPEVVTRAELSARLWNGDTFVDFDHALSVAVNKIREVLGDSAENPRFIQTVPKRGYRFIVPAEPIPSSIPARTRFGDNGTGTKAVPATVPISTLGPSLVPNAVAKQSLWTRWRPFILSGLLVGVLIVTALMLQRAPHAVRGALSYTQLTNFADSAYVPAISPDGRMIAFIRGGVDFPTIGNPSAGQVYGKLLPNGEAVQLTADSRPKSGLAFSVDGSRISYTVTRPGSFGWDTVTIPALGGDPQELLPNAASLTWLGDQRLLFSHITTGVHMGIVVAASPYDLPKTIYLPQHERAMAHLSFASPDRRWVIAVESDRTGVGMPCRLIPLDGSSGGHQVGPAGECIAAGWSPDGSWMFFSARIDGRSHLWRQRSQQGTLEQITFGPSDEEGVAVVPDGRSLITAVGIKESTIWIHDSHGDRPITREGYASFPALSADAKTVYYELRRGTAESPNELWATDIESGKSAPVVPGFSLENRYDVSGEAKEVAFAARRSDGKLQVWVSPLDRGAPPIQVTTTGGDHPFFGQQGELIFRHSDGKANYLHRVKRDGSGSARIVPYPILNIKAVSPDRRWAVVFAPVEGVPSTAVIAVPVGGGPARRICPGLCTAKWTSDGSHFFVKPLVDESGSDRAILFRLKPGEMFPALPSAGLASVAQAERVANAVTMDFPGLTAVVTQLTFTPGPNAAMFAYTRTSTHRNLFRIQLP